MVVDDEMGVEVDTAVAESPPVDVVVAEDEDLASSLGRTSKMVARVPAENCGAIVSK